MHTALTCSPRTSGALPKPRRQPAPYVGCTTSLPVLLGSKRTLNSAAPHVRVAELEIDATQLEAYKTAVTEEIEASIQLEPGVLAIYSLALKDRPTHLRFLEIYADESAYRQHIDSPHFKKYVEATKSMITARKLIEMDSPSIGIGAR